MKTPVELLVESWLTSLVKERESALISRHLECMGLSSSCCTEIDVPLDLRPISQGISGVS